MKKANKGKKPSTLRKSRVGQLKLSLANNKYSPLAVVVIALLGILTVRFSLAAMTPSNQIALMYSDSSVPYNVEKPDPNSSTIKVTSQPFEFIATVQGDLYCKANDGQMHKASLGPGVMKQLSQSAVVDMEEVRRDEASTLVKEQPGMSMFASDGKRFSALSVDGAQRGAKFNAAVAKVKSKCQNSGEVVDPVNMPTFSLPSVDASTGAVTNNTRPLPSSGEAEAGTTARYPVDEDVQLYMVNLTRNNYKVSPALARKACIDRVSINWATWMAATRTLYHNPNFVSQVANSCNVKWLSQGENVGVASTSLGVFNAFMYSPPHKANILEPKWTQIGIGSARTTSGPTYVYIAQNFLRPYTP